MLVLSRKKDERIAIILPDGRTIWVMVVEVRPNTIRLGIDAPREINVKREEVST